MTITYCMMTQDRLSESSPLIKKVLPYVDRVIVIDGGSRDGSLFFYRNWCSIEPKLEFYIHPWLDNFSAQRNNYLSRVEDNSWCLVSDDDEEFETKFLEDLPNIIAEAESKKKDMVGIQCRSVTLKGPIRVWENLDQYHKRLLFKKYSNTVYAGNPHERLMNHPHQIMDTSYIYEHIKQENVIWQRGFRNAFVNGGGPNLGSSCSQWNELRSITTKLNIHTWAELDKYLMAGNIDSSLYNWLISVHDLDGFDGSSEYREGYKYYFRILHPASEPLELKNKYIK